MRFYFLACLLLCFFLGACAAPRPDANPDKNIDYRSTTELQDRRATLDLLTAKYQVEGMPDTMTNRRQLPQLKHEMSANQLREKQQIERELAKRYAAGDKKAYFEGIENVKPE